jgi:hypothetical protein
MCGSGTIMTPLICITGGTNVIHAPFENGKRDPASDSSMSDIQMNKCTKHRCRVATETDIVSSINLINSTRQSYHKSFQESIPSAHPYQNNHPGKLYAVSVVIFITIIPLVIAGFVYLQSVHIDPDEVFGKSFPSVNLKVDDYSDGNWTVLVIGGGIDISDVRLIVIVPSNADITVRKALVNLIPMKNDPDAIYYDRNGNAKLDTGDNLILQSSGGHIIPGYNVRLIGNGYLFGSIGKLPA